jgi:hypothetical protein
MQYKDTSEQVNSAFDMVMRSSLRFNTLSLCGVLNLTLGVAVTKSDETTMSLTLNRKKLMKIKEDILSQSNMLG